MPNRNSAGRNEPAPAGIALTTSALLVLFVIFSYFSFQPPAPIPSDAPPTQFSAVRAMAHDRAIASHAHPTWSPAAAQARDYIMAQLKSMGLDPQIQATTGIRVEGASVAAASVQNVIARIAGTANTKAVMLAAHYDSVPTGPGASDDGSGVSTVLETVRAIKAGQPLKNDVIVLITDAEEEGLLGASGFVSEHPWVKDVGVALNFEARGAGGPSFMFETSNDNGWLIDQFAKAAPHPAANSLTYAMYKLLPNDTDMTEFKRVGMSGLNFAYAGDWFRYHTMLDSPDNLDQRSLQQDGSYAISLVNHFGNLDLSQTRQPDESYFNIVGSLLVHYRQSLVLTISIIVAAAFIAMFLMGRRRGVLRFGGTFLGIVCVPVTAVVSWAVSTGVWWIIRKLRPELNRVPWGDPYNGKIFLVALILITVAVVWAVYGWCSRRTNIQSLAVGALFWWVVAAVTSALLLPGASFLFAWPALFGVIGLIYFITREGTEFAFTPVIVLCLTALPLILLATDTFYGMFLMISLNLAGALMAVIAFILAPLVAHLWLVATGRRTLVVASLSVALVLIVIGLFTSAPGPNRRSVDDVFYVMNSDNGQARWISVDPKADEFTSQFLGQNAKEGPLSDLIPGFNSPALNTTAPALQVAAPQLQTVSDESANGVRTLNLHLSSPREAPAILFSLPKDINVTDATVNGKPVPPRFEKGGYGRQSGDRGWTIFYTSVPKQGFDLTLKLSSAGAIKASVYDISFGLPELPGQQVKPRPDYLMPVPYMPISDTTIITKTFDIPAKQ